MRYNVVYLFLIFHGMTHDVIYSLLYIRRRMKYKATSSRVYWGKYNGWTKKVAPSNYNTGIGIYDV